MTNHELEILRRICSIGSDIAGAMCSHPDLTARQIAGDITDKGEPLDQFCKALNAGLRLIYEANGDTDALAYLDARARDAADAP